MSRRIADLNERAKTRCSAEVARARELVDQHRRRRPIVDIALSLYERDGEVAGAVISSAIAFRLFLFFVPMLLFGVGLASQLAQWVDPDGALDASRVDGALRAEIREALAQPGHTRWVALALGLFGMISAGRTLSKTTIAASALAWRLPVRSKAPTRVVGSLIGLIATIGLVAILINRVRADLGLAVASVSFAAALVVYVLAWMLVLALLPRPTPDPGAVLPGAILVAAVTAFLQLVSQLYLPGRISEASDLYGAFGATVVTLGWLFALGRAIVLGMVLNAVLLERLGSASRLVFELPLLRALPRRYPSVRRYFGLDREHRDEPEPDPDAPDHPDRMMPTAPGPHDDATTDTKGGAR